MKIVLLVIGGIILLMALGGLFLLMSDIRYYKKKEREEAEKVCESIKEDIA